MLSFIRENTKKKIDRAIVGFSILIIVAAGIQAIIDINI